MTHESPTPEPIQPAADLSASPVYDAYLMEAATAVTQTLRRAQVVDYLTMGPLRRLPGALRDIATATVVDYMARDIIDTFPAATTEHTDHPKE